MLTFFDRRYYKHAFEELITFYPRYYWDVREMIAILHAHGWLMDNMMDNVEVVYNDCFIDYMDAQMITRLEEFLGINKGNRTLEQRRIVLKAYFVGFGKLSATWIKNTLKIFGNVDVDVVFEPFDEEMNNALYITVYQDDELSLDIVTILEILHKRIPAHIRFVLNDVIQIYVDCRELEKAFLTNLTMHMFVRNWRYRRLDGRWPLDGSALLDGFYVPLHMGLVNTFKSQIQESWGNMVIHWQDWYLNGEYLLNGERKFCGDEEVD